MNEAAVFTPDRSRLEQRFAEYLIYEKNLSATSAATYAHALERLQRFCNKPWTALHVEDVRAFLRWPHYNASTKNSTLVGLKAALKWGVLEGLWPVSPIMSMDGPKLIRNPKPSLSTSEVQTLLLYARKPNEKRVLVLGLYAGLRVSESARIGHDEWLEDRLRFLGKGRKIREVPVHPELLKHRTSILTSQPTADTLKSTCRSISFASGIHFSSHSLRRTAAVRMSEARIPREVVGAILGHAPTSVTESAYAPVRWEEKLEAMERLTYANPS